MDAEPRRFAQERISTGWLNSEKVKESEASEKSRIKKPIEHWNIEHWK